MPKVTDLSKKYLDSYACCLEEWNKDMTSVAGYKHRWMKAMKSKGLRCKIAFDDESGEPGGMIEYMPIEVAFAEGEGLYFINCIWVHGHKKGRGNLQKRGMGRALLEAAEEDARKLGAKGMAAWGVILPFWMRASFYRKFGYKRADRIGIMSLVWKPFSENAAPPKWIRSKFKPELIPGKVVVTSFLNGQCAVMNLRRDTFKRVASEFGDKIEFHEISTVEKVEMLRYGRKDSIFVDRKEIHPGPPMPEEKIRKILAKRVAKL